MANSKAWYLSWFGCSVFLSPSFVVLKVCWFLQIFQHFFCKKIPIFSQFFFPRWRKVAQIFFHCLGDQQILLIKRYPKLVLLKKYCDIYIYLPGLQNSCVFFPAGRGAGAVGWRHYLYIMRTLSVGRVLFCSDKCFYQPFFNFINMIVFEIDNNVKLFKNEMHFFNILYCAALGYNRVWGGRLCHFFDHILWLNLLLMIIPL